MDLKSVSFFFFYICPIKRKPQNDSIVFSQKKSGNFWFYLQDLQAKTEKLFKATLISSPVCCILKRIVWNEQRSFYGRFSLLFSF